MPTTVLQAIHALLDGHSTKSLVEDLLEGRKITRWWQAHAGDLVTDVTMGAPVGVGRVKRQDKNARVEVEWLTHPHYRGKTFTHTQGELKKLRKPGEGSQQ